MEFDCHKQQEERKADGVRHRCLSQRSDHFGRVINDSVCSGCPVREAITKPVMPSLPVLPPCEYRMGGKCLVTSLPAGEKVCGQCVKETKEAEAGIFDKVGNYTAAIRYWVAAGRPVRSDDRVKEIYDNHCSKCSKFDHEAQACKSCGCSVNKGSFPLTNKLKMATEGCPLGQFTAERQ